MTGSGQDNGHGAEPLVLGGFQRLGYAGFSPEKEKKVNRTEHLLTIVSEECAEIAQRVSKALRFGLDEVQPGQELTNAQRIEQEINDLYAVLVMCRNDGFLASEPDHEAIRRKKEKVENYLRYSEHCGTLSA